MNIKMKIIKPVTDLLTPPCEDITRLISKSLDTRLTFREKWQVRIHIIGCKLCHMYQKQLMAMDRMFRKSAEIFKKDQGSSGEGLSKEAYHKIKSEMDKNRAE